MGMGQVGVQGGGNLGEQLKVVDGIRPIASTGAVHNGLDIDRRGFNVGLFEFASGAVTGAPTAQTYDGKIQDSAAGGGAGYTDSTAGQIGGVAITQIVANNGKETLMVDFRSMERFVRPVATTVLTAGTTPTWPINVSVVLGAAYNTPTV